jgi:hypothetical protein
LDDEDESKMEIIRLKKQRDKKRKPVDRQSAFVEFKGLPEGKQYETSIINSRTELKDMKGKVKELTDVCNQTKKEIDVIKS